eukprot:Skav222646  [mRNA]  locus=scaffold10:446771:453480:- [translate_table: standard]
MMLSPSSRMSWRLRLCLLLWLLLGLDPSYVPSWWQQGWPRTRLGSVAEAELLSQLAVLLRPETPIAEMFRSFPAPEEWGRNYLEPDLTVYGVLKEKDAALFVEYDGYWRHGERAGAEKDRVKNEALVDYAPSGSWVVRISHTVKRQQKGQLLWVTVDPWRRGDSKSLHEILRVVLQQIRAGLGDDLLPRVAARLKGHLQQKVVNLSECAQIFTDRAASTLAGNSSDEINKWLLSEGFSCAAAGLMQQRACLLQHVVTSSPRIFSYKYERIAERLAVLHALNRTHQLAGAMTQTAEAFSKRYGTVADLTRRDPLAVAHTEAATGSQAQCQGAVAESDVPMGNSSASRRGRVRPGGRVWTSGPDSMYKYVRYVASGDYGLVYRVLRMVDSAKQAVGSGHRGMLARRWHPDKVNEEEHDQAVLEFRRIHQAYENLLADPERSAGTRRPSEAEGWSAFGPHGAQVLLAGLAVVLVVVMWGGVVPTESLEMATCELTPLFVVNQVLCLSH